MGVLNEARFAMGFAEIAKFGNFLKKDAPTKNLTNPRISRIDERKRRTGDGGPCYRVGRRCCLNFGKIGGKEDTDVFNWIFFKHRIPRKPGEMAFV